MSCCASQSDSCLLLQVERYSQRINELEKTIDRLTLDVNSTDARCKAAENRLMADESLWRTERTALEEKLKKASTVYSLVSLECKAEAETL